MLCLLLGNGLYFHGALLGEAWSGEKALEWKGFPSY